MDLVDYYKLPAVFTNEQTTHTKDNAGASQRLGRTEQSEVWLRKKELGRGAFGVIFLEQKQSDGKLRAVKMLSKVASSEQSLSYLRELSSLASLRDRALFPDFLGWFENEKAIFIAMEYFTHGDLAKCVQGPLPERECKLIAYQIVDALQTLHERGLTHRDLKPQNILVSRLGPSWWVKVGDFGLSKRVQDNDTSLHTRFTGPYVAPEVLGYVDILDDDDDDTYTNAIDIWSAGCLIFWLHTNELPFSPPTRLRKYCQNAAAFHDALQAIGLSISGLAVVRDCLCTDPVMRLTAPQILEGEWLTEFRAQRGQRHTHTKAKTLSDKLSKSPSAFHRAVQRGDIAATDRLLREGHSLDEKDDVGASCIHYAVLNGDSLMLDHLMSLGVSPSLEIADEEGVRPIHLAAGVDDVAMIDRLVAHGEEPDAPNAKGETALFYAAQRGRLAAFQHLVALGLDPGQKLAGGWTCLHSAIYSGNVALVRFIQTLGLDFDSFTPKGTPYHLGCMQLAAQNDRVRMMEYLRLQGLSLIDGGTSGGLTVFQAAIFGSSVKALSYLATHGVDLATEKDASTLLGLAVKNGSKKLLNYIRNLGSKVHSIWTSGHGKSPFSNAVIERDLALIDRLYELGMDIKHVDSRGRTLLHEAADLGFIDVFDRVYELGSDINARDDNGYLCLHYAATKGHIHMVKRIRGHGQLMNSRVSGHKVSVLQAAAASGQIDMVEFLCDEGADPETTDRKGHNALEYAIASRNVEMCRLLLSKGYQNPSGEDEARILAAAAFSGSCEILDILILEGYSLETPHTNMPIIFQPVVTGNIEMFEHLRGLGQDITELWDGMPAIHIAAQTGQIAMLDHLCQMGLDIHCTTPNNLGVLHSAIAGGQFEMLKHLIGIGVDPNKASLGPGNKQCVHFAALMGQLEILKYLESIGCNIKVRSSGPNSRGWTVLHYAAYGGQLEMAEYLIGLGFEPGDAMSDKRPYMVAEEEHYTDLAAYLEEEAIRRRKASTQSWG